MDTPVTGSQTSLREANMASLFNAVTQYGAMTQVELAENTGLSTATVSNLVHQLVDDGIFETTSTIRSGRRATLVAIARQMGIGVGIHIAKRELTICITNFSQKILAYHTLPLALNHKADSTLERTIRLIQETVVSIGASLDEIVGIVVALAAPIDYRRQRISVRGILREWDDVDIAGTLSSIFHTPVYIDNDANTATIAEAKQGAASSTKNFIYVHADDGIGGGIYIQNALWRGYMGMAGEIGHIQVDPLGDICACGNRGCLDTVINENRLVSLLSITHGDMTMHDLINTALEGDPGCRRVVADSAVRIGTVIAQVCISIDPESIVVGGTLSKAGDIFINPLQESIQRLLFPDALTPIAVIPSPISNYNVALGASILAIEEATLHKNRNGGVLNGSDQDKTPKPVMSLV